MAELAAVEVAQEGQHSHLPRFLQELFILLLLGPVERAHQLRQLLLLFKERQAVIQFLMHLVCLLLAAGAAVQTLQLRHQLILEFLAAPVGGLPFPPLLERAGLERLDREILAGLMLARHLLMAVVAVAEQVLLVLSEIPQRAAARAALEFLIQSRDQR